MNTVKLSVRDFSPVTKRKSSLDVLNGMSPLKAPTSPKKKFNIELNSCAPKEYVTFGGQSLNV